VCALSLWWWEPRAARRGRRPDVAPITTGEVFGWLAQFSLARVVSTVLLVD
jgi:hypothetical protein